jgi:glycosyltransferase involved in cell wall biosynthesis
MPAPTTAACPEPAPVAVSVVIACRNGAATLPATLAGLFAQRGAPGFEIVLADNGSTDGSAEVFRAAGARHPAVPMRVLAVPRRGKPFALNAGIAAARAPALVFCDADDVPGEGWVAAMAAALAAHPLAAPRLDFARLNAGWARASRGTPQSRRLEPLPFLPHLVGAGGAGLGVRREVALALGGFDPDFPYGEDTEFCLRAQVAGFVPVFVPEAVMHVRARGELAALFRQSFRWGRCEMRVVARYRGAGVPFAGGWRRYLAAWRRLLGNHLRKGLVPRPATMLNAARLRMGSGRLAGQLVGMLRHRVPPWGPAPEPAPGAASASAPAAGPVP